MASFIGRRLLIALPVLLGVTVITYVLLDAAPGNAVTAQVDPQMTAVQRAALEEALGLHEPMPVRYVKWLGELARGNLGYSFVSSQSVAASILARLPATLELMVAAMLLAYLIAIPVGVLVAVRHYSRLDYAVTLLTFLGISAPSFFVGLVLIYLFSLQLGWLPASGIATVGATPSLPDRVAHLVLPASVLALNASAGLVRYVRGSMLETLGQDYVRTAHGKGLRANAVLYRHALRNAMLPLITLAGLEFPRLFAGAVITEQVFGWPGMGTLAVQSAGSRDYPMIMALTLISAGLVIAGNLVADVLYAFADPRIRLGSR